MTHNQLFSTAALLIFIWVLLSSPWTSNAWNVVMFSKYVLCLLYNFNLWGFCTEFPELRTSQKWTRTILGVQLICSCFLCGFVWLFLHQLFYIDFDLITIVNDVLKFSLATFSYLCIIGESYYNRSKQQNFWIIYRRIRNDFNRSDCDPSFRNYFIKLLQFFITVTVVEIKHFTKRFSLIFFSTSYFGLMTMQEMRIFYYLFSVQLLDYQLNEIGTEVKLLADASENGRIPRGRLRWIRVYYDLVYDLSNYLNEVIGWSNVVNIMYLFLRLVFDLTWIYWQIQHKDGVAVFSTFPLMFSVYECDINSTRCHCRYGVAVSSDFAAYLSIQRH